MFAYSHCYQWFKRKTMSKCGAIRLYRRNETGRIPLLEYRNSFRLDSAVCVCVWSIRTSSVMVSSTTTLFSVGIIIGADGGGMDFGNSLIVPVGLFWSYLYRTCMMNDEWSLVCVMVYGASLWVVISIFDDIIPRFKIVSYRYQVPGNTCTPYI